MPGTPGVPAAAAAQTLVLPYNDPSAVEAAFAEHGDRIACLITEAAPGNMGVVPPEAGFNRFLSETCARHGALFVSDEVMTGFRVTRCGQYGLDGAIEGWRPDLMTFGKVMGGGFPAAAFGGRADVMALLSPQGPVYQAGTLSGNPVAVTGDCQATESSASPAVTGTVWAGGVRAPAPSANRALAESGLTRGWSAMSSRLQAGKLTTQRTKHKTVAVAAIAARGRSCVLSFAFCVFTPPPP